MAIKERIQSLRLAVLAVALAIAMGGSAYAMNQVTREVPATVTVQVAHGPVAEPSLGPFQDPVDGATGVKLSITRVFESRTGEDIDAQLASFQAQMSYDGSCLNILEVRPLDFATSAVTVDDTSGITSFDGVASPATATPSDLNHVVVRLVGSNQTSCSVTTAFTSLLDNGGNRVLAPDLAVQNLLRGDARADGNITIADALFIAQYLVGLRPACADTVDFTCLHSVNAASVRHDGDFDQKTIADALFIAQHLVGLRDKYYNLIP
ncbi:MAG: hypothetical protein O2860_08350 [Chloroflexi bacterium]|nr:hypothetical protein [Chloroflexota bacterium]